MKPLRSLFVVTLAACTLAALAASAGAAALSGVVTSGGKGIVGASVHLLELEVVVLGGDGLGSPFQANRRLRRQLLMVGLEPLGLALREEVRNPASQLASKRFVLQLARSRTQIS